jgi:hypothetical protein
MLLFQLLSFVIMIWISSIKLYLVVIISPYMCVLEWFRFKLTHMHEYEIYGNIVNDAKEYKIKMYICNMYTTH